MDHFCQIEIKQPDKIVPKKLFGITIGKKVIPQTKVQGLYFDLYAWFLLFKEFGWDFELIQRKPLDELSTAMIYTGAISYEAQKYKPEFNKEQVNQWLDELPAKKLKEIGKVLTGSMQVLEEMKQAGAGEKKK